MSHQASTPTRLWDVRVERGGDTIFDGKMAEVDLLRRYKSADAYLSRLTGGHWVEDDDTVHFRLHKDDDQLVGYLSLDEASTVAALKPEALRKYIGKGWVRPTRYMGSMPVFSRQDASAIRGTVNWRNQEEADRKRRKRR